MTTIDSHDKASVIMLMVRNISKSYVNVLDLMGMLKTSDAYYVVTDDDGVEIRFRYNKDKGKK